MRQTLINNGYRPLTLEWFIKAEYGNMMLHDCKFVGIISSQHICELFIIYETRMLEGGLLVPRKWKMQELKLRGNIWLVTGSEDIDAGYTTETLYRILVSILPLENWCWAD